MSDGNSPWSSDLRLIAVFIMGISVGICVTVVYFTWHEKNTHIMGPPPAASLKDE